MIALTLYILASQYTLVSYPDYYIGGWQNGRQQTPSLINFIRRPRPGLICLEGEFRIPCNQCSRKIHWISGIGGWEPEAVAAVQGEETNRWTIRNMNAR